MSARREARRRDPLASSTDGVPAALAIGPCIEVWSSDTKPPAHWEDRLGHWPAISAHGRFSRARREWFDQHDIDPKESATVLRPGGHPWSVDYLLAEGRADYVRERLARADCTTQDIPALRSQAAGLLRGA